MSELPLSDTVASAAPRAQDTLSSSAAGLSRRILLGGAGGAALVAATGLRAPSVEAQTAQAASATSSGFEEAARRRALDVREATARANAAVPIPPKPTNGDEDRYANKIGSDTRALPHDGRGEVDPAAWKAYSDAVKSGDPAEFEKIPLGGTRKFLNPIGSLAVGLTGLNATQFSIPPAHALASPELGAEAIELYWQSLLRDVPLAEFRDDTQHPGILAAVAELNALAEFTGPRINGRVTPSTLFRANALYVDRSDASGKTRRYVNVPGVTDGPVVSQFLFRDAPWGNQTIPARIRTYTPASTFHTEYDEWLAIQNGAAPKKTVALDPNPRYIATGRDLAAYAHFVPVSHLATAQLLLTGLSQATPAYGGIFPASALPVAQTSPYAKSKTQTSGSQTFGTPHIQGLIASGVFLAQRAAYYTKFWVHRSLRPEAYAGLVHHRVANRVTDYPIHANLLNSQALDRARAQYNTHLLTQVYPEGAPIHPSYPGGATIIGVVQATILKAFFDESQIFPNPVQADPADPTKLVPYQGPPLTIGGELNKLAINYGTGRNWSGIHWRSDFAASLALGEDVAISILRDERATYRESFDGFKFTRFDGTPVTI